MTVKRALLVIKGRVQGVFFRATTQDEAVRLGLTGWVRNLWNGDVEALFEGEEETVKEMIVWCHHGPSYARVDKVEVKWDEATGEFRSFQVTH